MNYEKEVAEINARMSALNQVNRDKRAKEEAFKKREFGGLRTSQRVK
jgi:hypothetical protein